MTGNDKHSKQHRVLTVVTSHQEGHEFRSRVRPKVFLSLHVCLCGFSLNIPISSYIGVCVTVNYVYVCPLDTGPVQGVFPALQYVH